MSSDPEWYERLPRWAQKTVDQIAHAAIGAGISGLVGGVASIWLDGGLAGLIGAAASAIGAVIYECVQNIGDAKNGVLDAVIDACVWTAAGIIIGAVIWGVA